MILRRTASHTARKRVSGSDAFSLIEILVVVTLLTVIIFGLMAMFNQTQRAFRTGMTQVDVLEAGRGTMDLLTREVEQMAASRIDDGINFYVDIPPVSPVFQAMPNTGELRSNFLSEFFFLSRVNQQWQGIGYRVSTPADGVGTLYRFYDETNNSPRSVANLFNNYSGANFNDLRFNRIADGIVHLRVRAYDINGVLIDSGRTNLIKAFVGRNPSLPEEVGYEFYSNALPAYVDIELGVLEPRTLERLRSIPDAGARRYYLERQAGRVHLFRQRIPIRNVDPAAYR